MWDGTLDPVPRYWNPSDSRPRDSLFRRRLTPVLSGCLVSPVLPVQTASNSKHCLATWHRKSPWAVLANRRRLAGRLCFLPPPTVRSSPASSCLLMVESPKYERRQAISYGAIKATHADFRYQPIAEPEELGNRGRIRCASGRFSEAPAYGEQISSLPGTIRIAPFISFSTCYPERTPEPSTVRVAVRSSWR
jgi:hypothetical protein